MTGKQRSGSAKGKGWKSPRKKGDRSTSKGRGGSLIPVESEGRNSKKRQGYSEETFENSIQGAVVMVGR